MSTELRYVMLVEDDTAIQTIAQMSLEMVGGLKVSVASSGGEALRLARADSPQLILLDVMMPDMDGPQTLAAIQADPELKAIPVVFMTAKVQKHEVAELESLGVLGVIPKPFDPMALTEQVKALWNSRPMKGS